MNNKMNIIFIKKLVVVVFSFVLFFGISFAARLGFSPDSGTFSPNCIVPIDLILESEGEIIKGVDLIIDTSMKFVDFVSSDFFDVVLPPRINDDSIILGMISTKASNYILSGKIGTIYLKTSVDVSDSYIQYVFNYGDTTDTNLFIKGSFDVLNGVDDGGYYLLEGDYCNDDLIITGGFAGMSYQESLDKLNERFLKKTFGEKMSIFIHNKWFIGIIIFLLVIFMGYIFIKNKGFQKE